MTSPSRDPVQEARTCEHEWTAGTRQSRLTPSILASVCAKCGLWFDDPAYQAFLRMKQDAEDLANEMLNSSHRVIAAVRAEQAARLMQEVEGMAFRTRRPDGGFTAEAERYAQGYDAALDRVLAVLRAELNSGEGGK